MIETRIDHKIDLICSYQREKVESLISVCESPIEKLFLTDFIAYYFKNSLSLYDVSFLHDPVYENKFGDRVFNYKQESQEVGGIFSSFSAGSSFIYGLRVIHNFFHFHFDILPQYNITISSGKEYRVDIAILVTPANSDQQFKVFIECDGHEFHKEPEQIAMDNLRANELKKNGWMEFRYSGKMIWNHEFTAPKDFDHFLYNVLKAHGDFFEDD